MLRITLKYILINIIVGASCNIYNIKLVTAGKNIINKDIIVGASCNIYNIKLVTAGKNIINKDIIVGASCNI